MESMTYLYLCTRHLIGDFKGRLLGRWRGRSTALHRFTTFNLFDDAECQATITRWGKRRSCGDLEARRGDGTSVVPLDGSLPARRLPAFRSIPPMRQNARLLWPHAPFLRRPAVPCHPNK